MTTHNKRVTALPEVKLVKHKRVTALPEVKLFKHNGTFYYTDAFTNFNQGLMLDEKQELARRANAYQRLVETLKALDPMFDNDSNLLAVYTREIEQARALLHELTDR